MPAIYALRRQRPESNLSDAAREALDFIIANGTARRGGIRRLLQAEGQHRPDAADLALAELQRELLVDRGPSAGPSKGVFYLTRDGLAGVESNRPSRSAHTAPDWNPSVESKKLTPYSGNSTRRDSAISTLLSGPRGVGGGNHSRKNHSMQAE